MSFGTVVFTLIFRYLYVSFPFLVSAYLSVIRLPNVTGLLWQRTSFFITWLSVGVLVCLLVIALGQVNPAIIFYMGHTVGTLRSGMGCATSWEQLNRIAGWASR